PTMFTIANDLTKMQILANIDEADVGKVREGMDAKFTVDAWPGETFKGTIREVRQAPTTISNVVTYAAVIDAPNPQKKLRQGMTAQVQVTTGKRDDAVRVPNAALRFHPAGAPERGADKADKKDDKTLASAGGERPTGERGAMRPEGMRGPRADGMRGDGAHGDGARGDGAHGEGEVGGRKVRLGRAYKLVDGKPVAVQLKLGLADSVRTEVLEGLAEGDVVITGEAGMPMGGPGAMGGMRPGGTAGAGPRRGF
ncbi:MAG: efflux RND transporter periplasmic adaptor subunit, partial [Deltaproteobacteria bacterium]|nr:efflux RND transporter periplasmic adaptor subunit [Deltaproteobacteria bacterium]